MQDSGSQVDLHTGSKAAILLCC